MLPTYTLGLLSTLVATSLLIQSDSEPRDCFQDCTSNGMLNIPIDNMVSLENSQGSPYLLSPLR